jgi:hypothetical protein
MCGDMWPLVMVTDDGRLDGTGWRLVVAQPRAEGSTSGAASGGRRQWPGLAAVVSRA